MNKKLKIFLRIVEWIPIIGLLFNITMIISNLRYLYGFNNNYNFKSIVFLNIWISILNGFWIGYSSFYIIGLFLC